MLSFRIGLVLVALVCALNGCAASSAVEDAWNPVPLDRVIARAEQRIFDTQNENGSWGGWHSKHPMEVYIGGNGNYDAFQHAVTALSVMALLKSEESPELSACRNRAIQFLLTEKPQPRSTTTAFYDIWAHAYRAECFAELLLSDRITAKQRKLVIVALKDTQQRLYDLQNAFGAFGYYEFEHASVVPSGSNATSFCTALFIRAMVKSEKAGLSVEPDRLQAALMRLESCRLADGSFGYGPPHARYVWASSNKTRGNAGRIGICQLALYDAGSRYGQLANVERGLEVFREGHACMMAAAGRRIPHEAYYQNAGYYVFFGHRYAMEMACELKDQENVRWMATHLQAFQNDFGGFQDFKLYGYGEAYGTAFVLTALNMARQFESDLMAQNAPPADSIVAATTE